MQIQEVILKALSGEIHWFRAAEILGMHPRSVRRWRERHEQFGLRSSIRRAVVNRGAGEPWRHLKRCDFASWSMEGFRQGVEVVVLPPGLAN